MASHSFVAVSLAILLAAAVVSHPLVGSVLIGLAAMLVWAAFAMRRPAAACLVMVGVVVLNAHALALIYQAGVPAEAVRVLIVSKDVLAWVLLGVLVLRNSAEGQSRRGTTQTAAYVAVCLAFLVISASPAPLATQLLSIRGALVPVLALAIVSALTLDERVSAAVGSIRIVAVAAAYALVEQLLLPRGFLLDIVGVGDYWRDVKQVGGELSALTGLPANYFTEGGFPRLVGTFGDPLTSGSIIGAAVVLSVAFQSQLKRPGWTIGLLSVALLLSFTRNGWLLALLGLTAIAARSLGLFRTLVRGGVLAFGLIAAVAALAPLRTYVIAVMTGRDSSTLAHQQALSRFTELDFSLVGTGWGTGGSAANNAFAEAVTSESSFVALLAQVGWLGGTLLVGLIVVLAFRATQVMPSRRYGLAILGALGLASVVSENTLAFNAGWFPFLAVGLAAAAGRPGIERASSPTQRVRPRRAESPQMHPAVG